MITAMFVPGFEVRNPSSALIAALVLGLVNAIIRPILVVVTFPFTLLSLGLFLFVINAVTIWIASVLSPGFYVANFTTALVSAIVLTLVAHVLNAVFPKAE